MKIAEPLEGKVVASVESGHTGRLTIHFTDSSFIEVRAAPTCGSSGERWSLRQT